MTRVSDGSNFLASEYDSNEELIDAIICSSFIPFYCGMIPPKYRDEYYVDGGLSNNIPVDKETPTLKVQPWQGEADICPRDDYLSNFNFTGRLSDSDSITEKVGHYWYNP